MKNKILANWNFIRIIRLIVGIIIIIEAVTSKNYILAIPGVFFAGMAVLNSSCCNNGNCNTGNCDIPIKNKEE
jgi:hypothetical protein